MHNAQCTMHDAECTMHDAECTEHDAMHDAECTVSIQVLPAPDVQGECQARVIVST
jgi:hypothetical protein